MPVFGQGRLVYISGYCITRNGLVEIRKYPHRNGADSFLFIFLRVTSEPPFLNALLLLENFTYAP